MIKKIIVSIMVAMACSTMGYINADAIQNNNNNLVEANKKDDLQKADDDKLKISLEDYLNQKEKIPMFFVMPQPKETKEVVPNGLEIINTDFNWNNGLEYGNKPKKIILHHIEASRPGQTIPVTDIDAWHKANGWAGIGYHFYVTKTGKVYRGRPENAIGAHALNNNVDTLGISVEGKYQTEHMPDAQKKAVVKLGQYLRQKYEINTVIRHMDVNNTNCPGKNYPYNDIKTSILSQPILPNINGETVSLGYSANVEGKWSGEKFDGNTAGTIGKSEKIEGIKMELKNSPKGVGIEYRAHMQDVGWKNWVSEGQVSGAENKRLEAMQVRLTGPEAKNYKIEYRAHVQDIGWMPWVSEGNVAGTEGKNKRLEAFEVRIEKKNEFGIGYRVQGQDYGWQCIKTDGQIAGITGEAKRMETIMVNLYNSPKDISLKYRTHVQDIGWMPWVNEGKESGTVGKSKRIEALQIELTGANAKYYKVEYSVHIQDAGWSEWKSNGQIAGTTGQNRRIEAMKIRLKRVY